MVGKGRMGGSAMGPEGNCVCPDCGYSVPHERGMPCTEMKCPKCGSSLVRK